MSSRRAIRALVALVAGALSAAPGDARADGIQGQAEETYANSSLKTRDAAGNQSTTDGQSVEQVYRLALDETLYPQLRFRAAGFLDWTKGWSRTDGIWSSADTKVWDGNAHLTWGGPMLNGGLDYDRREQTAESRSGGISSSPPGLVREVYGGSVSWNPLELPSLELRLSRTNTYDTARRSMDQVADDALVTSRFDPVSTVDLRYVGRYGTLDDRLHGVDTTNILNSATATWNDRFLEGRGNAYVSYALAVQNTDTSIVGAGGTVQIQRLPTAGLSLIEGPVDDPTRVTLTPNAALIDGVTTASAAINLGFNASATPPVTARDVGAQLQDAVTRVSDIAIWVDRDVSAVANELVWTAYQSNDNLTWTPVPLAGAAAYDPLQFRFDIPILPTAARYLKVVTKPILRALTTDPRLGDIFVTELQLFDVRLASEVRGHSSNVTGALNGTTRLLLLKGPSLAYDGSVNIGHTSGSGVPSLVTYSVTNGLSMQKRLAPGFSTAARVDRQDSDVGTGHEALDRWSGTLSFDPLPTLGGTIGYSGQVADLQTGRMTTHSGSAFLRADLYEGISSSATGSVGWTGDNTGHETVAEVGTVAFTVVPNRAISSTASASINRSTASGGGQPSSTNQRGILELTASVSPYRTVSLGGSVVRLFGTGGATTLVNFNGGVSLFPGGDLQLSYAYQEALDTTAQTRIRTHGPGLRWNIRRGWILTSSYTFQHQTSPTQTVDGQAFAVNLVAAFR